MTFRFYLLACIAFFTKLSISDGQNLSADYTFLSSKGAIPQCILTSAYKKYQEEFPMKTISDSKRQALKKKQFYLKSNYALNTLLESGRVAFGDEITVYVNKVADVVLKNNPSLRKELQFYALKSASINSVSISQGYVFVNVGLVANIKSEAELAFIIAHEIAHYKDEHALNSYFENIDLEKGRGKYRNLSFDARIDQMFKNSRETEFKADSAGLKLFLTTDYDPKASVDALNVLHYNYLPFEEIPFDKSFFNTDNFKIPSAYFVDSVKKISLVEDNKDVDHTHPNIFKRKQKLVDLIKKDNKGGKSLFIVSEAEFKNVRELARFETIRLELLNKSYGDAIYNSYVMLQTYPNNQFLKTTIAKALYGLALYKNIEEFQKVAKAYIRVEGESQQVHSLVKQLNKKQLNSLALSYTRRVLKECPSDFVLNKIEKKLLEELVTKNKLLIKDYKNYYASLVKPNPAANGKDNGVGSFFYAAIAEKELNDSELTKLFNKAKAKADSLQKIADMSVTEKEAFDKANLKSAKKYGINRKIQKVQFVDPFVSVSPMEKEKDFLNSDEKETILVSAIGSFGKLYNKPTSLLKTSELKASETEQYNKISLYKEMVDDIFNNDDEIELLPLGVPISQLNADKGIVISRIGVITVDSKSFLMNILVDFDHLDIVYTKSAIISGSYKEKTLLKEFDDSFKIFK